ncbi:MAG: hypothetical protein V2A76_12200 [Planctomycetota bacterium]
MSRSRSSGNTPPVKPDPPGEAQRERFRLTDDLLLSRFSEKSLAPFLLATLPAKELVSLAPRLGLSPLPGKRLKTMSPADHALLLARSALEEEKKTRTAVLSALEPHLPAPLPDQGKPIEEAQFRFLLSLAGELPPAQRIGLLLSALADETRAGLALEAVEQGLLEGISEERQAARPEAEQIKQLQARLERAEQRAGAVEKATEEDRRAILEREKGLRDRIEALQRQLAAVEERLAQKKRECDEVRGEWETLKGDLQVAFRRAARFKAALDATRAASERETSLEAELAKERQRADIEASKLEILEYQLDLLEQEDESSAETRIIHENDPVPERVLRYVERHGSPPRLLVVGGAGKQRTHRERDFAELKNRLGVEGEWRFADYGSWHRELPRLRNDIRNRFDLVFVLHWNRTTFVQKMHDEARAANARVRTVPYRGFLSLEKAVREEVDRFVQEST